MGSFLSRPILMVFGYAYPAYECFKAVEKNKPEIEQLLFWCQYWVLVAVFTVGERVGDTFISWLPMYSEAKLAFFIYLWYPKTKGTTYVYNVLLRPYIAKHEKEIDLNLLKLRIKAREIGLLFWEKAAIYGQTRFFEILQYFSSHSASLPHSDQAAAKMETMPVSSSFHSGNLINSYNQKAVSSDQAIPQSRSKWRPFRTAASP
ncbi:putative HVA22-like protein g [Citrus sinensis]|uniref:HVA22-like protein g n=1 Tax=Citrus sinensis TaxID=2711 RepID=A0ACB8II67_CITSI|nr:putative HVA22-like protein g [Citrus sinensis]